MNTPSTAVPPEAPAALVVDDDAEMCRVLELALASIGCMAITADTARRAIDLIGGHRVFVAFVDARLPDMDGWLLIEELRRSSPVTRIVMISGYYFEDDICVVEALQASRIDGFLAKPFEVASILAAVRCAAGGGIGPREGGRKRP